MYVLVSNLPPDTAESDLLEMLEEVGGIRSLQYVACVRHLPVGLARNYTT